MQGEKPEIRKVFPGFFALFSEKTLDAGAPRSINREGMLVINWFRSRVWPWVQPVAQEVRSMRVSAYAANAGYFLVLSVFPSLLLLLSLLRYTALDVEALVELLEGVVPDVLLPAARKLIVNTYASGSGAIVSVSAFTALWSASRGVYGLVTGLNEIYGVQEDRGMIFTRGISVLYTFLFLLVLLVTLVLHVFGSAIASAIAPTENALMRFLAEVIDIRLIVLIATQTLVFTAIYAVLPNGRRKLRESLPGALFACLGWLAFSALFSIYVEHFNSYANIFGSVYAVALSMLWLYFCICIVFYGGAINHLLMQYRIWRKNGGKM